MPCHALPNESQTPSLRHVSSILGAGISCSYVYCSLKGSRPSWVSSRSYLYFSWRHWGGGRNGRTRARLRPPSALWGLGLRVLGYDGVEVVRLRVARVLRFRGASLQNIVLGLGWCSGFGSRVSRAGCALPPSSSSFFQVWGKANACNSTLANFYVCVSDFSLC